MRRLAIIIGVVLLAVIALYLKRQRGPTGDVPLFRTAGWSADGSLLLRTDRDGARDSLVLRQLTPEESMSRRYGENTSSAGAPASPQSISYRYVPGPPLLAQVDAAAWNNANGSECDCDSQGGTTPDPFELDGRKNTLYYRGTAVPTSGRTVLWIAMSPTRSRVAVLSAEGARPDSVMPFLGVGGASGQHYHECFRASDGIRVGPVVRLPLVSHETAVMGCWSANEEFVVYYDILFQHLSVVDSGLLTKPTK